MLKLGLVLLWQHGTGLGFHGYLGTSIPAIDFIGVGGKQLKEAQAAVLLPG